MKQVLTMEMCLEAMEESFRENGRGEAVSTPWCNLFAEQGRQDGELVHYVLRTSNGCVPATGVTALRINSELFNWAWVGETRRKVKLAHWGEQPLTGFVVLFDNATALPVGLMPDRHLDRMRVAATNALGVKYLARPDASRVGLLGSGWQATAQLQAFCAVRSLRSVRVFSPSRQNRDRFAREMGERLQLTVEAVSTPETAVEGADILAAATNSVEAVVQPEWLRPGMHVSALKELELSAAVLDACHTVAANLRTPRERPVEFFSSHGWAHVSEGLDDYVPGVEIRRGWWRESRHWQRMISLEDLVLGREKGREHGDQITLFLSRGVAHQFSAAGARILRRAGEQGLGREIPLEVLL